MSVKEACQRIVRRLIQVSNPDIIDLDRIRVEVCRELGVERIPGNAEVIRFLAPQESHLKTLLTRKRVRTISGVCIVAVMTKPYPCPTPKPCLYCPGGPSVGLPQSYTGHEPAAMRGLQNKFNPFLQVRSRIAQLEAVGHRVDKVELIILGGTFTALPLRYQRWFVKRCLEAVIDEPSLNLGEVKVKAEGARVKNVGVTVETRPDWFKPTHVDRLLDLGVTRVELGVQTTYDEVYRLIERGHAVRDVVEATQVAKDSGLSLIYHMMPNLPGSSLKMDRAMFKELFENPAFRPDALKIYPCLVLKGTRLHEKWLNGSYKTYNEEDLLKLLVDITRLIPPYVRVQRVNRDIPSNLIEAGPKKSNLRQLLDERLVSEGLKCRCIRCREVGHIQLRYGVTPTLKDIRLKRLDYEASEGQETFLSFEDVKQGILIAYLRLRTPSSKAHRPELIKSAVVRELHVYGPMLPVGEKPRVEWQHRRYGRRLLTEAERISLEELDIEKLMILSALGVKGYYKRLGYSEDGVYVSKRLKI